MMVVLDYLQQLLCMILISRILYSYHKVMPQAILGLSILVSRLLAKTKDVIARIKITSM